MPITIDKFALHFISIDQASPIKKEFASTASPDVPDKEDVLQYLEHILSDIHVPLEKTGSLKGQVFNFKSDTERVASQLLLMYSGKFPSGEDWESCSQNIAEKLHSVELDVQKDIEKLTVKVKEGALLQVSYQFNNVDYISLIKIDDHTYLDSDVMTFKNGFPLKTRVQKVAMIEFSNSAFSLLNLSDTKPVISKYWWNDFLEATPIRSAKTNTENAFKSIETALKRNILSKSKQDYYFLRNQLILDLREDSFKFSDFVDKCKKYKPVSENLTIKDVEHLVDKLISLPFLVNKEFDLEFEVDSSVMTARIKTTKIVIDDFFELQIKQPIEDLRTRIGADEDSDGNKFVKIYSEDGYNLFKRKPD